MKNLLKTPFLTGLLCFFFGSLHAQTPEFYLKIAAEDNPEIRAAYIEFEAAMKEIPQVKSLSDPQLSLSAFGMFEDFSVQLMQLFPWFGTLEARENVAVLQAEAKMKAFEEVKNRVFMEVIAAYYKLYELEQKEVFEQENLEISQNYKQLALSKVSAGNGRLSDALQTTLIINESEHNLQVLKDQKKAFLSTFNLLLNRDKTAQVEIPSEVMTQEMSLLVENAEVGENPRLLELQRTSEAYRAQEVVAKKQGMPSVGVGVEYMRMNDEMLMMANDAQKNKVMPMLSLTLPIFRKKIDAAREQAVLMAEAYEQREQAVKNELESEVENALFEAQEAANLLNLYEKQVESSRQILNLLVSSYSNAATGFEEVLRVRQELLKYQLAMAASRTTYFTALARIHYLSGKSYNYEIEP